MMTTRGNGVVQPSAAADGFPDDAIMWPGKKHMAPQFYDRPERATNRFSAA
jgi:hypothetical protein